MKYAEANCINTQLLIFIFTLRLSMYEHGWKYIGHEIIESLCNLLFGFSLVNRMKNSLMNRLSLILVKFLYVQLVWYILSIVATKGTIFIKMGLYFDIQEPEAGAACSVELVSKLVILILPLCVLSFAKKPFFRSGTLITSKPTLPCMITPSQQICIWQLWHRRKHSPVKVIKGLQIFICP